MDPLMERHDRLAAWREGVRVVHPGGTLIAYGITRFAALLAHTHSGAIYDNGYIDMLRDEVETGYHKNAAGFIAHFHMPDELRAEAEAVNLNIDCVIGVIGPCWMAPDFDAHYADAGYRAKLLEIARMTEPYPMLCPRTLVVARKPE